MSVLVEAFRTREVFQSSDTVYFWNFRDSNHYWGYNVFPSPDDRGFQDVEIFKMTYSIEENGSQNTNLWVRVRRPGLIFFTALRAPFG
jgi:hypothetical protein